MSWFLYFTAKNEKAAREYVNTRAVATPENPNAMPQAARDLIVAAIDLAAIGTQQSELGIKCEASGHSPGSAAVKIEAIAFV